MKDLPNRMVIRFWVTALVALVGCHGKPAQANLVLNHLFRNHRYRKLSAVTAFQ
jgi:hypothetical protein